MRFFSIRNFGNFENVAGIVLLIFSAPENEEGCIFRGCTIEYKMGYFDEGNQDIIHVTYP